MFGGGALLSQSQTLLYGVTIAGMVAVVVVVVAGVQGPRFSCAQGGGGPDKKEEAMFCVSEKCSLWTSCHVPRKFLQRPAEPAAPM